MGLLTKVAKGVAFGDVSNQGVRNVLTEISKKTGGKFTEQEMYDTLDYFDWKCPYTGRDLRKSIESEDGSYATDHIYPQNKDLCGLNVKGNLIIVDKKANAAKKSMSIEDFLLTDEKVLGTLDKKTRGERLQKIKDFQTECGYDPEKIKNIVSTIMVSHYDEIRELQERCISKCVDALKVAGVQIISPKTIVTTTHKARTSVPELLFHPKDENQFKEELLKTKKARFVLTYQDGAVKESIWNAENFSSSSNLKGNIQSRPFWRNKATDGLIKVEVYIA